MNDEASKEDILINVTPSEVRAALLENGVLQEVFVERAARRGLISNIYKGKVSRVLPGMQAAFIDSLAGDIGQENAECFAEALGKDVLLESLRASLTGAEDTTSEAFGVAASFCGLG